MSFDHAIFICFVLNNTIMIWLYAATYELKPKRLFMLFQKLFCNIMKWYDNS